jgi:hypothetical protein
VLARLTVPFADASAGQLSWDLSPATGPALAAMSVVVGEATLRLAVLGASHQVDAQLGGVPLCVESVTCETGGRSPLPKRAERAIGGVHYRFTSRVERLDEEALSARAHALRCRLATDPHALVASFPGYHDALTGVAARSHSAGVRWRTWHAYPATGELVRTSTTVVRR